MIATATEPPKAPPTMTPIFGLEDLEEGLVIDGVAEPDIMYEIVVVLATVVVGKTDEGRVIETTQN